MKTNIVFAAIMLWIIPCVFSGCHSTIMRNMYDTEIVDLDAKEITHQKTGCDKKDIKIIRDNGKSLYESSIMTGTRIWTAKCSSGTYICSASKTDPDAPMKINCSKKYD